MGAAVWHPRAVSTGAADPFAEHRQRVLRAAEYIVTHIGEPLRVADVARVAFMSEFHFHRVFAGVMHESVWQFVLRRRMEVGALMLAYHPWRSVTEIGIACGFATTASFSKAFSGYFGCRPSDVRRGRGSESRIGQLTRRHGKDFSPRDLYSLPDPIDGELRKEKIQAIERGLRFEQRAETPLACLRSPAGYDTAAVLATWDELITRGRQLGFCEEAVDAFGIPHDSPSLTAPELRRYDACVPVQAGTVLPAPLFHGALPAGRYAVFRYEGPVLGIEEMFRGIYSLWFPASSLSPDDRFMPVDHYIHDAPAGGLVDMEILIKVQPRGSPR